ncbi:MAG: hypothetical protein UT60_C0029G0003 [candidate division CPR2 bacterium GW2011_GWD2_39_7]|nr:MAG: hypothetical protein UT60_C0029G0003 [candidate division CPR2 bacterium GW2011_GWD2_39_7]
MKFTTKERKFQVLVRSPGVPLLIAGSRKPSLLEFNFKKFYN